LTGNVVSCDAPTVKSSAQIQSRVDAFVRDLEVLIRQAALDAVQAALGTAGATARPAAIAPAGAAGAAPVVKRGRGRPKGSKSAPKAAPSAAPAKAAAKPAAAKKASKGGRKRRSTAEIDAAAAKIHSYVSQNPGSRAEAIKAALKIPASEWALPVQKLISEGKLATKGAKRATTYSAKR
jgi:hypothetical protein